MIKNIIIVILINIIPLITFGQKSNLDFGSSINYGTTPPTYTLTAHYKNTTIDIITELIEYFGKSYEVRGDSYFIWESVKIKKLSNKPLNILIIKRVNISTNDKHEYYDITIKKGERQFLKEILFWNRLKIKRIFKKYAQPIQF